MSRKQDPNQMTLLDQIQKPRTCERCGGTILAPTIGGVPRGTCHCSENLTKRQVKQLIARERKQQTAQQQSERVTDWTAKRIETVKRQDPQACCREVIERYESIDPESAEVAKNRYAEGTASPVALFCPKCTSRLTFTEGRWWRES